MPNDLYVIGAAGQLGTALLRTAPEDATPNALTSADIDITDRDSVAHALAALGAGDVVINCAAYTNVDGAESDEAGAVAVNVDGPRHLAERTASSGAWLIHVSTDYVFGGDASSPYEPGDLDPQARPATVYGRTKLDGERAALQADPRTTVVRTAWVYTGGPQSPDFVGTMRRLESQRDRISVVDDQRGSPTYAPDLAVGLWELASIGPVAGVAGQVLHATNAGEVTWWEVARAVFADVGADPERVAPCTTDEFPRPAPRPAYSVLSGASWVAAGLTPLRDWRAALDVAVQGGEPVDAT